MKELSIEEKAMAYDYAINKAKDICDTSVRNTLKEIFPELAESEDEKIRKKLIEAVKGDMVVGGTKDKQLAIAWLEKQGKKDMGISEATKQELEDNLHKALEKETPESWNEFLDEQGEQKPADKVEPKFKVGDWVVKNDGNDCFSDGSYVLQIKEICHDGYMLSNNAYLREPFLETYRLWTIQDAKDGDVLMSRAPFIYGKPIPYGGLDWYNGKFIKASNYVFKDSPVHPATKEQRDTLEKAMTNAGYRWDKEKLKMEKI